MSNFRLAAPFSMLDTGLFFGFIDEAVGDGVGGLPLITTSFSVDIETVSRVDFIGRFFSDATGQRDGTISAIRAGAIIEDGDGNPTDLIGVEFRADNLDTDRSQFDDAFATGDTLTIFSLLAEGDDIFRGSSGDDELRGFDGDDRMIGGAGNDELRGGAGEDTLIGGAGNDFLDSGSGDGLIRSGGGADTVIGRAGVDTIVSGGGADNVRAGGGDDDIKSGGGGDTVSAGGGDDIVRGGGGDDDLQGDAGADRIVGGGGEDTITGGLDDDRLTGGSRGDTFVFRSNSGDDIVTDYRDGVDMIQIDGGLTFADIDIQNIGANALITFGGASVTLLSQDAAELTADDFLF